MGKYLSEKVEVGKGAESSHLHSQSHGRNRMEALGKVQLQRTDTKASKTGCKYRKVTRFIHTRHEYLAR